ncbi:MAG: hypothetical protein COY66_06405 [Candidatus Kerfeldbacteria bacterium CG_4_10_14_0_8_um_filter_42_10]|uniref:Uncharacterized protein n=1 Tax=Candidatus Kerfeldbacteria bacterium CG_4_10_14_0_8_um_filter_42_10 TaxID=2014248 RepID=A0A2M7RFN2_9BACT|nr:MAG: hypothetical protein COY66_06405 [Candidatus Kerfeldbacteria bacterium CG_4_10_14_0_8_um_filter_42_10]
MRSLVECITGFIESLKGFLPQENAPEPGTGLEVFLDFCQYPVETNLYIRLIVPANASQQKFRTAFLEFVGQRLNEFELPNNPELAFTDRERGKVACSWEASVKITLPKDISTNAFGKRGITRCIHRQSITV